MLAQSTHNHGTIDTFLGETPKTLKNKYMNKAEVKSGI